MSSPKDNFWIMTSSFISATAESRQYCGLDFTSLLIWTRCSATFGAMLENIHEI